MAFTVTSNYAGKAFGQYVSAALKEAKSLEGLTVLENIKYKENIRKMAGSSLVADATCDFADAGTLAITESVLEPKNLQINVDLCKKTLLSGWEAEEMKAGAFNRTAPTFDQYVLSYFGEIIADSVESSIWTGAGTAGTFVGFLKATTGPFATGGTVQVNNVGGAGTAYTAGNIIAQLQALVAAIPANVYGRDDLRIYMNMKTYRFYISAISTLGYVNAYNMNGDYVPVFEGITIQPCPGMPDNKMVAAETSNLFYGCDLVSEDTGASIKMLDMSNLDGSDNLRVVAKFSGGVQVGIGADVVSQA